ncbi:MAG: hypothetical protein AAF198_04550 [Pseudomonadota bacterium]
MSDRRRCKIVVYTITHDPFEKVRPVYEPLLEHLNDAFRLIIVSNHPDFCAPPDASPFATFKRVEKDSIFHMRARIPKLVGDCDWLIILEDHNHPSPDWAPHLLQTLLDQEDHVNLVIGTVTNAKSQSLWSWANFIAVLGAHWHPLTQLPVESLAFNTAIRRDRLPKKALQLGALETKIIPSLMPDARPLSSFPVDHYQNRTIVSATLSHWRNGRTTGSLLRTNETGGAKTVAAHALFTITTRHQRLSQTILSHPNFCQLPRFTLLRCRYLALVHAVGAFWGFWFGHGAAPWKLE